MIPVLCPLPDAAVVAATQTPLLMYRFTGTFTVPLPQPMHSLAA